MKNTMLAALVLALFFVLSACSKAPEFEKKAEVVIGVLQYTKNNLVTLEGFKAGMAEQGYGDEVKITYVFDGPAQKREELDPMARALVAQKPDLLFCSPTPATLAAKRATTEIKIPVVFAPVNDPLSAGIVSDLQRPGDNITGIRLAASDGRRLEWLLKISPSLTKVFLPYNSKDKSALATLNNVRPWAEKLGVELLEMPVTSADELNEAMAAMPAEAEAIFLPRDGLVMSHITEFVTLSLERKVLLSTPRAKQVEKGALFGYGFVGYELGKHAARLAGQILKGSTPAELPIETAEDYLFINMKSAEAIGLTIEDHILRQAHTIIR